MIKQTIEITTKTDDLRVSRQLTTRLQQWQADTLTRLQQEPGKPKYPIRWTSERQRRAYFATKGFGRGIPTRRTHALSKGWNVTLDIDQIGRLESFTVSLLTFLAKFGVGQAPAPPPPSIWITVDNAVPYEQYVTGVDQQGFHKDTGWYSAPSVLDTAFREVEGIINTL